MNFSLLSFCTICSLKMSLHCVILFICFIHCLFQVKNGLTFWSVQRMEKKRSRMELKAKSIIGEHEYMGDGEYSVVGFKADKSKYILLTEV